MHDAFYEAETLSDPFEYFAKAREEEPVRRTVDPVGREIYIVTSASAVSDVARRMDDFSSQFSHLLMAGNAHPEVEEILKQEELGTGLLLSTDDPDHKRFRAQVNAAFATGRVANMAPDIEVLVDELIDGFIEKGHCNFTDEFAVLLPTYIIADILGLPREDYGRVKEWSDAIIGLVGRMGTKESEIAAAELIVKTRRYIKDMVAARRREPRDDLVSNLIHVDVEGVTPLTDLEVGALAFETSVAGNETTRNTLMSGMVQLIRHPDQMQALIDDPSLTGNAVEEMLRYETPASSMWRIARHDTTLEGVDLPAGAVLLLRYDAASRDPAIFQNPEEFNIFRKNANRHFAFGAPSPHRCLGQMLARKELNIALPKILSRMKNIRIAEGSQTDYMPALLFHVIGHLNLEFDPGPKVGARLEGLVKARK
ncbi:putative cytochrome P450 142 [Novosphingobium marinum]|uniref:Cytochrome P450 n=1 Tax=Novosphingobium marinum TaxID=1514948 RepID=A0A7Y9XSX9_9SPHN|nr:cytochrome P450 [Novosphingobium marinum]NYH93986.1 cytochrome P450 [Novosphingobium marinum]GGC18737.1 putative cytochrome P450 142 [Novosphingobium marinum]